MGNHKETKPTKQSFKEAIVLGLTVGLIGSVFMFIGAAIVVVTQQPHTVINTHSISTTHSGSGGAVRPVETFGIDQEINIPAPPIPENLKATGESFTVPAPTYSGSGGATR